MAVFDVLECKTCGCEKENIGSQCCESCENEPSLYYEGEDAKAKAEYMAINFGVESHKPVLVLGVLRVYIKKQSEHIFQLKNKDYFICTICQHREQTLSDSADRKVIGDSVVEYYKDKKYLITRRDGKQFFMPKREVIK